MTFPRAVAACPRLSGHFSRGLGALRRLDRGRVTMTNTRLINASVNVEDAQREAGGQDPTWDYGIGISAPGDDVAIWVEVHSADSHHVQSVLNKLDALLKFLKKEAPDLNSLPGRYVWLATGRVHIAPDSRERRRLNSRGLVLRSKQFDLQSVL